MSTRQNTYQAPAPADFPALTPFVERLAKRYGSRRDPAESLSRAWAGVWRASETYRPDAGCSFETWAIWYVRGKMYVLHRAQARHRRVAPASEYVERCGTATTEDLRDVFGSEALDEALTRLPTRQRQAVELVYFRGLDREAAGLEMGVTRQAVQNLLAKALVNLREGMGA